MNPNFDHLVHDILDFLGLSARESPAAVQHGGRETHFMEIHRRVWMYLRALWNVDFIIKQTDLALAQDEDMNPFIEDSCIYLPSAFCDFTAEGTRPVSGLEVYRAAAVHASAHIVYSRNIFPAHSFDKWQAAVISAIEDARVEALAIRKFPGLQRLWARQHKATPNDNRSAGDYLDRLARTLLDRTYRDDDPWISKGRTLFDAADNLDDNYVSRDIGLKLADLFREKKISFDLRADTLSAPYRDDNRCLWKRPGQPLEVINPFIKSRTWARVSDLGKVLKHKRLTHIEESEKAVLATYYYPEWNYRSRSLDQSWVTLREITPLFGDARLVDRIVAENHYLLARMKKLLQAIRDGAVHRLRKLEEGDELDINDAIRTQVSIRLRMPPNSRVMMRTVRKTRDISVLLLLDLSNSMNNPVKGRGYTAMQLTQQASALFADALGAVGDTFAIHGFCSENRHNVEYFRLKDFGQPYDDVVKSRIAGLTGQLSTRMGAAIRHATSCLNSHKSGKKLLILMSDGEPYDVDMLNRKYLRDDARESVNEARRNGIHTYCISLDPGADKYVSRIFGAKNYLVVDHLRSLPEKILQIYAALTR